MPNPHSDRGHRWKKKPANAAPNWKPGQSGNPGGKRKGIVAAHNLAVTNMVKMLERVMAEPEIMDSVEKQFRKAITTNAPKAMREYVLPFLPVVTATQTEDSAGKIVRRLSISQLKELAAELDDEDRENSPPEISESSQVIDIDVDAGENGKPA